MNIFRKLPLDDESVMQADVIRYARFWSERLGQEIID